MPKGQYNREDAQKRREERAALLKGQLSDTPDAEPPEEPLPSATFTPTPTPGAVNISADDPLPEPEPPQVIDAPMAPATPDLTGQANLIAAILGPIITQLQAGNLENNKALLEAFQGAAETQAKMTARIARDKRPENVDYPDISVYNPYGERDFPRPALQGRTFYAQQQPDGLRAIERLFELEGGAEGCLTYDELLLLNALPEMGPVDVTLNDDSVIPVSVLITRGANQAIDQKLILLKYGTLSKMNKENDKNRMPSVIKLCRQLLGGTEADAIMQAEAARIAEKKATLVAA